MARVGRRGEERDAIPGPQLVRARADCDDPSPSLVTWVAARKRVPEPVAPFPGGRGRGAHGGAAWWGVSAGWGGAGGGGGARGAGGQGLRGRSRGGPARPGYP